MSAISTLAAVLASAFTFQSSIRNDAGRPIEGLRSATINLRLYQTVDLAQSLWGRQLTVAVDPNGLFTCELSDDVGVEIPQSEGSEPQFKHLDEALNAIGSGALYAGFTCVGSSVEVRPRARIMAVPMAVQAVDSERALGDFALEGEHRLTTKSVSVEKCLRVADGVQALRVKGSGGATVSGTTSVGNLVVGTHGAMFSQGVRVEGKVTGKSLRSVDVKANGVRAKTLEADVVRLSSLTMPASCPRRGQIVLWFGDVTKIPEGWALCDGGGGTPDLRDRFVVGAGASYQPGDTGGAQAVSLDVNQIPAHSHAVFDNQIGRYTWNLTEGSEGFTYRNGYADAGKYTESTGGTNGKVEAHPNLPPYRALVYLMKL